MSSANANSAKQAFGSLRESFNQGEYVNNKKSLLTYCNSTAACNKIKKSDSYNRINLFNNTSRYIVNTKNNNLYTTGNLIANQQFRLNLKNECVVIPSNIEYSNPSYCGKNGTCQPCTNVTNTTVNVNNDGMYITNNSIEPIPFYQVNTIDPYTSHNIIKYINKS